MSDGRPQMKARHAYDYHEVIDWIEKKYDIKTRDYGRRHTDDGDPNNPYLDFWHWMIGNAWEDVQNGCYEELLTRPEKGFEDEWDKHPKWVNEIFKLIDAEFPEADGQMTVWIEW